VNAMLAVDTNLVVRLLIRDDQEQYERARQVFDREAVLLTRTVLLEADWVLRYTYRLKGAAIAQAIESLLSLPNIHCEAESEIRQALAWHREGMDFADALHLSSSHRATRFVTFDRAMIKSAEKLGLPVSEP
jgi:predicted nucleic-acid-binding protein